MVVDDEMIETLVTKLNMNSSK